MTDYLFIEDFELPCRIGTTSEEKGFPQIVTISVRAELSLRRAGLSDRLADTLDYAKIVENMRSLAASRSFTLAEALAEAVAALVLDEPDVTAVEIRARKKVFAGIGGVGAFIRREKEKRS